ncbi:gamma carbonic anhydrase family protein [Clostridium polynesiense]|uniref:gamma carbonic anhydrase family protein n=1 Tax=Clostridium polynesiense TaxID=1325933 RepID=UPI00058DD509|nr:gamma carbonic anhydrase family protein [Clostridium polynesiense]
MIINFLKYEPEVSEESFVANNASVIGRVKIKKHSSIWFGAVIRGDENEIEIDENTNIQDNCILHTDAHIKMRIGKNVTVGHGVIIHGCNIKDNVLVGMGTIILNGAEIGENSIVGAGSLITENKIIPPGVLCMGSPARVVRELTKEEIQNIHDSAEQYKNLSKKYK